MTVRRFLSAALFALTALSSLPATAEPSAGVIANQEVRRPGQVAREGVDNLLRAFDQFVATIPQYALPELNGQGDIIIRRKNPPLDKRERRATDDVTEI